MALYGGLDLSYTGTGAVVLNEAGALVAHTVIRTDAKAFKDSPMRRLAQIRNSVLSFFGPHRIEVIAIEAYAHGAKFGREQAGELGGVVRLELWESGFRYINVAPPTLKSFVTGKGNAEKNVMLREVFRKWSFEAQDDNEGDAYALARLAMAWAIPPDGRSKVLNKLLEKVVVVLP